MDHEDEEYLNIAQNLISESLSPPKVYEDVFTTYVALTVEAMNYTDYDINIQNLRGKIDPFIRDQQCSFDDEKIYEMDGKILKDFFKTHFDYCGRQLIVIVLGLHNHDTFSIKLILKSFEEKSPDVVTALAMAQHVRLNTVSEMGRLDPDSFQRLLISQQIAHVHSISHHTQDRRIMDIIMNELYNNNDLVKIDSKLESLANQIHVYKCFNFLIYDNELLDEKYEFISKNLRRSINSTMRSNNIESRCMKRSLIITLNSPRIRPQQQSRKFTFSFFTCANPLIKIEVQGGNGGGGNKDVVNFTNTESFDIFISHINKYFTV
jgi:hypothetical protein